MLHLLNMLKLHLTFAFLLLLSVNIMARSIWCGSELLANFQHEVYNGGSKIYSIATGKNGIAYFGDKNGVITFNGEKWSHTNLSMPVHSIALDKHNHAYIAGDEGIGVLKHDSLNNIVYSSLDHLISNKETKSRFKDAMVFNVGDEIVFIINNKVVINTDTQIRIIENKISFQIAQKLDDRIYLTSIGNGIYTYYKGEIQLLYNENMNIVNGCVGFIENKNGLIIWGNKGGSNLLSNGKITLLDARGNYLTRGIEQINDDKYALKTFYDGLIIVDTDRNIINHITRDEELVNNNIFCVATDKYKNLWIGTSNGISVYNQEFPATTYNTKEGIGTGYSAITIDNHLFLATSSGLWERRVNEKTRRVEFNHLLRGHVLGMTKINSTLYFGHPMGLFAYKDGSVSSILSRTGGATLKQVPYETNKYLVTVKDGFVILEKDENGLLTEVGSIEGSNTEVNNFDFDNEGKVWVEYLDGIFSFEWENPKVIQYYTYIEPSITAKYIRRYREQLYYITEDGVYERNNNTFQKASLFSSLNKIGKNISNIIVDNSGKVWAFLENDIYISDLINDQLEFYPLKRLSTFKGLYSSGFENVFSLGDSSFLIGYEAGFIHYEHKGDVKISSSHTRITEIASINKRDKREKHWGDNYLTDSSFVIELFNPLQSIQNAISFHFSAGEDNYRDVKYQTYLEGYSKQWSEWDDATIKEYTNLAPGKYQFMVRSVNSLGEINQPAICHFEVLAPWYNTQWARLGYVLLGVSLVILLIIFINHLLNRQEEKLLAQQNSDIEQEKQQKRQIKLEAERELIRLKNEKLRSDNIYKSKELANLTYSLVQKNKLLIEFNEELDKIKRLSETNKIVTEDIHTIIRKVNRAIDKEENWEVFEEYFDTVHENFFVKLKKKFPDFSSKDLRLCAYLRMNLTTKEIAPLMNISVRGVEIGRYRLRRKLDLDRSINISNFLNNI